MALIYKFCKIRFLQGNQELKLTKLNNEKLVSEREAFLKEGGYR